MSGSGNTSGGPIRVFLSCTGVGVMNRGIETFARECFDGLKGTEGLDLTLYKGAGSEAPGERVLWSLPRTGRASALLGKCVRRNSYVAEQLSSFLPMVREIRKHRPHVIFTSESNLRFQLYKWRNAIGVPYVLIHSNGGPTHPPFIRTDHVQQVAPHYLEEALAAGEPASKHSLVPYGITVPDGPPSRLRGDELGALRRKLGLPAERPIVLSVGWISARSHKRMTHLVSEVAAMAQPRPFLMMLGAMDEGTQPVVEQATRLLGPDGFAVRSVPYAEVGEYYRAADVFALASLQEGFGRVYLEALVEGLPVLAHDHPVMRYVLGSEGVFADATRQGCMAAALATILANLPEANAGESVRRRQHVRAKFSWPVIRPDYLAMFRLALANGCRPS